MNEDLIIKNKQVLTFEPSYSTVLSVQTGKFEIVIECIESPGLSGFYLIDLENCKIERKGSN